jgi:hypothetical protein
VPIIIVLAIAMSLFSLAYPSIATTVYTTEPITDTSTIANIHTFVYPDTITTYASTVEITQGWVSIENTACWPPPDICIPPYVETTAMVFKTRGYTDTTISTSAVELTSTSSVRYTHESTHAYSQNVPPYASLGLSDIEFMFVAMLIIMMGGFAIFYSRRGFVRPQQTTLSQFIPAKPSCLECGADLPPASKFCNNCGTKQP